MSKWVVVVENMLAMSHCHRDSVWLVRVSSVAKDILLTVEKPHPLAPEPRVVQLYTRKTSMYAYIWLPLWRGPFQLANKESRICKVCMTLDD